MKNLHGFPNALKDGKKGDTFVDAVVNHREDSAKFGFKGGQSLRHYIHHNAEMLEYIEEVFK